MDIFLTDWLILICTALALWGGHWFPWQIFAPLIDAHGALRRVPAYIYGVTCINAGMAVWSYAHGNWAASLFLLELSVAAGIGTVLPRFFKRWLEAEHLRQEVRELWRELDGRTKN